jgi:thioredoxin-like negative regulator of GroEL
MKPAVSRLRAEGFKIQILNVRQNAQRAYEAGVRTIPTLILRVNGEEVQRITGRANDARIRDLCRGL